jgi:hypothetical protein
VQPVQVAFEILLEGERAGAVAFGLAAVEVGLHQIRE